MIASIPSPSSGVLEIGPFDLRAYGVMIGLGVVAAVWLFGKRLAERGYSSDHAASMALWVVPAGLVGSRLYHVITDWRSFQGRWNEAFYIWEGGLGILGGVAAGAAAGLAYARYKNIPPAVIMDAIAPALPLAQAIGRWGNFFNQELYGKPTDLPWGLEIDAEHRVAAYPNDETFHPTFLYESIWNLSLVVFLIWLDRRHVLKPGRLFFVYTGGYALGRLWIEALRIDTASQIFGLRVNLWVFGVVLVVSAVIVATGIQRSPSDSAQPGAASGDRATTDAEVDVTATDGTESADAEADRSAEVGDEKSAETATDPIA